MKNLISISDLTEKNIRDIFAFAAKIKKNPDKYQNAMKGKSIGLIFEKPSTRTWVSFEAGVYALGGGPVYLGPSDIELGVREEVKDIARVLSRYLSGVVMRTFKHATILEFSKYFSKPVINGLSNQGHPCQALADFFTVFEKIPEKSKPVFSFVGDGNNVLNSHILLAAKLGVHLKFATPKKHEPDSEIMEEAAAIAKKTGAKIESFNDPVAAVSQADVVYTDVWISMGQEKLRQEKIKEFHGMQVNRALIAHAKKSAMFMHCLPAHRGEEVTEEVLESKNSVVFDQAENRLHIQKAVLMMLFCG